MAHGAVDRAVEALGRDRAGRQRGGALHSQRPAQHEVGRRARGHPVHRQPGAPRADAAVEQRPARQGAPLGHGPASDRRHLQRRRRGAVPLEGLRPERAGDQVVGRRGHRQRDASMGDEVLRRPVRPALASGRRTHLRLALQERTVSAQRGAARQDRAALLGTDVAVSPRCRERRPRGRPRARHVSRADRGAAALRAGARGLPDIRAPRASSRC